MALKHNASYFLRKFKDIPDDMWTTGTFRRDEKRCALGHLGAPTENYDDVSGLTNLFRKYLNIEPAEVNDGDDLRFKYLKTPKLRILKALQMIKAIRQAK